MTKARSVGAALGIGRILAGVVLLVWCPRPLTAQPAAGEAIGNRRVSTGRVLERESPATTRATGAKINGGSVAIVILVDNDQNRCNSIAECRAYQVTDQQPEPDITYLGSLLVKHPTFYKLVVVPPGQKPDCSGPIEWSELVEAGRTVAQPKTEQLRTIYGLAQQSLPKPYFTLVWCEDQQTRGLSWALELHPKTVRR